jgi:hypothetical protein
MLFVLFPLATIVIITFFSNRNKPRGRLTRFVCRGIHSPHNNKRKQLLSGRRFVAAACTTTAAAPPPAVAFILRKN